MRFDSGAEGDIQALQKVLHSQGEKAKFEIDYIVCGSSSKSVKGPCDINASATSDDLWSRFAVPSKDDRKAVRDKGESWATAAEHIHKGVQRIVKYLPEDSE